MKFSLSDTATPPEGSRFSDFRSGRVQGKRILVTGAGGSIGSALVRTLLHSNPSSLVLLDHSEFALYELERSVVLPNSVEAVFLLGSAGDEYVLASIFAQHRPQIIFHTAAFKHVPLLERNPFAAISNNVLGTHALLQAAIANRVEDFIQVSTDKAVDPHSIMGASKRIAELMLIASVDVPTRISAVRLGNVWASQGSVVELFLQQIAQGGPLTVTHPDASRFFMTMDEAVSAILGALDARSARTILVPQLGEPVRIVDLAERLVRESSSAASIEITALRPGDKLTESLLSASESISQSDQVPGSRLSAVSSPAPSSAVLSAAMASLRATVATRDLSALLATVCDLVPEYTPSSTLLSLSGGQRALEETHA